MPLSYEDNFNLLDVAGPVRVALEPVRSAIESLLILANPGYLPGMADDWVVNTLQAMSKEERDRNVLVLIGLYYVVLPDGCWNSFPAYIDHLAEMDPNALRDKMLDVYDRKLLPGQPGMDRQTALSSADNYLAYLTERFSLASIDEQTERLAYQYAIDPPALQRLVVEHLHAMWDTYLSLEWERLRPTLKRIVRAFQGLDLKGKTFRQAALLVTGQDLSSEKWDHIFDNARAVIFVPNPHAGSVSPCLLTREGDAYIFFTPELPDGDLSGSPELSLTEIMIRLSALSDDVRLRILRQIAERGEQRSQEIMEALNLSQSGASRNLAQLVATGYLTERRCEGAKCYALNPERIASTLQAIANYLLIGERSIR